MNVNFSSQNKPSFKGYDARPLKAVVMTVNDSADSFHLIKQVSEIGQKDGFSVFFTNGTNKLYKNLEMIKEFFGAKKARAYGKWVQDNAVLTPENKVLVRSNLDVEIGKRIAVFNKSELVKAEGMIDGGNLFFVKNGTKNELMVGSDALNCRDISRMKHIYGVDKIHVVPQADYHLDLFIRPLNNKQVLVVDDKLTIKEINRGIRGVDKYLEKDCSQKERAKLLAVKEELAKVLKDFKVESKRNSNHSADEVSEFLEQSGFKSIRTPGRLYYTIKNGHRDDLTQNLNYINALVHEKSDKSLTYLTGKSELNKKCGITPEIAKKIGFDFEEMFVRYLEPFVKKDDIHFIAGKDNMSKLLVEEQGGLHCLCNEIPEGILG